MAVDPTNAPRSLITLDWDLERKVVESFLSTLKMSEDAPGTQACVVALTLGELRQHVQFCQYAAQQADQAAANNSTMLRVERRLARAERMLKDYQKLEEDIQSVSARMNNLKGAIEGFNKVRADLAKVKEDAKTDN